MTKLNPWHYITDATGGSSQASPPAEPTSSQFNYEPNEAPMINAIITVPGPDRRQSQQDQNSRGERRSITSVPTGLGDILNNSTAISFEQTIARLIEAQNSGSLEFSMNTNGDEIIVNPLVKSNVSREDASSEALFVPENQKLLRSSRQIFGKINSPLRKHISSDLDGVQQSASEIDSIDGQSDDGYSSETDVDYDSSSATKSQPDPVQRSDSRDEATGVAGRDDKRSRDHSNEIDRVDRSMDRIFNDRASNRDEDSIESNSYDSRFSSTTPSTSSIYDDDDTHEGQASKQPRTKQLALKRFKTSKSTSNPKIVNNRKKSLKKKASQSRSISDSEGTELSEEEQRSSGSAQPSVVIRGEDLKKFEQLLESLRSLSLSNLEMARSRRISRLVPKESDQSSGIDDDRQEEHSAKDDSEPTGGKRWSGRGYKLPEPNRETSSSSNRISPSKVNSYVGRDCSEKKQSLSKSASSEEPSSSSYEVESSVNSEQDNSSNVDQIDDLNDEGSQNVISEKQLDEKLNPDPAEGYNSTQQPEESPLDPDTVLSRKTILQTYYDNNAKHANSMRNNEEVEDIHKSQHEEQHRRHFKEINESSGDQVKDMSTPTQSHHIIGEESPTDRNYIDYSQLNNREIYRGQESRDHQVVASKDQLEKMRSLQQLLERATLQFARKKISKSSS